MATLRDAVLALSSVCDGAHERDGHGFNKLDTSFGHHLATKPEESWTPRERWAAYLMLQKYKGQLADLGIAFDEIPKPPRPQTKRSVRLLGDEFVLRAPYDAQLVAALREIPGRRFEDGTNYLPMSPAVAVDLKRLLDRFPFDVTPEARAKLDVLAAEGADLPPLRSVTIVGEAVAIRFPMDDALKNALRRAVPGVHWDQRLRSWLTPVNAWYIGRVLAFAEEHGFHVSGSVHAAKAQENAIAEARMALSVAKDADLHVRGLGGELRPFQRAGVAYIAEAKRVILADDMGLGKTIEILAAIQHLNAYPALVLCPASMKWKWAMEARAWLPGRTVTVLEGRTAYEGQAPYRADIVIANYDILRLNGDEPYGHMVPLLGVAFRFVACDESHYLKNPKAQRTRAALALAREAEYVVLASGTPITNRPSEILSQLRIADRLDDLGGWWHLATRYCGAFRGRYGLEMGQPRHLDELNERLRQTCYIRRTKDEVLKDLPPRTRSLVPVDLTNRSEYVQAEVDAVAWFAARATEEADFLASIADLPPEEREAAKRERAQEAAERAARAEALARIAALRRLVGTGKIEAAKEWIEDFLESGEKLVVFGWHREVVNALAEHFDAMAITGGTPPIKRQEYVDRFQTDPGAKLLVGQIKAMGEGLTLTAASNVAFLELAWTPSAHEQAEDRVRRIGQDRPVTAWYILAPESVDEDLWDMFASKLSVVRELTDGEPLEESEEGMLARIAERLTARVHGETHAVEVGAFAPHP